MAATAHAGRVVPMLPQIKPAVSQELRERFHDAVARGLAQEGEVVPAVEVRRQLYPIPDMAECSWGGCMPRIAKALRADRMVVTEIEQLGKTYSIRVRVFDAEGQEMGRSLDGRCEICSVREADASVQQTVAKAGPLLVVRTVPKVEESGPEAPRFSPAARTVATQTPAVKAEPPPRKAETPPPRLESPAHVEEVPPLEKSETPPVGGPDSPPPRVERPFPYRPVAYAAFAVAVASLVPTIVFGIYAPKDGQGTCDAKDPLHMCPQLYHGNTAAATAFGIVAGAAAITGTVLMILDWRQREAHKKSALSFSAAPLRDGFAAGAAFEF